MRILCNRENLVTGVQTVLRAVPNRPPMPVLSGILLQTNHNRLEFTATDLELGIDCSVPVQVLEEGSVVVPARIFAELVRRLPDTPIELTVESEARSVTVRYGPSQMSINGMDPEEFPVIPELENSLTFNLKATVFRNMVKQVAFAASSDENRPIFTGVLFILEHDQVTMVATDTHRLAYRADVLENSCEENWQVIIPAKTLVEVSRLIQEDDEVLSVTLTNNQIVFRFGEITLVSRLLDGSFPNYKQVIPTSCKTKLRIPTKFLLESVERASLLAKEVSNVVKLKVQDSTLIITSNSSELGRVYEEIEVERQGEETQIAFNSRFLIEALRVIDSEKILLELTGSLSPGIIRSIDSSNYLYLVLPVRTN